MTDFKEQHQEFIDQTTDLAKSTKEDLAKMLVDLLDLESLLERPEQAKTIVEELMEEFRDAYLKAIQIGNKLGEVKASQFKNAKTSTES